MKKTGLLMAGVFVLGSVVGAVAAKKGIDPSVYTGKDKKVAAKALLELARVQAGKGSWERLGVGRVYNLGGMKAEVQAIFDEVAKKGEGGDWVRIGRVYYEAGEWDKAKEAFDKALTMEPKDAPWLSEVGSYYIMKGDRAKGEEMIARSFKIEPSELWSTLDAAGAYLGIRPLR